MTRITSTTFKIVVSVSEDNPKKKALKKAIPMSTTMTRRINGPPVKIMAKAIFRIRPITRKRDFMIITFYLAARRQLITAHAPDLLLRLVIDDFGIRDGRCDSAFYPFHGVHFLISITSYELRLDLFFPTYYPTLI